MPPPPKNTPQKGDPNKGDGLKRGDHIPIWTMEKQLSEMKFVKIHKLIKLID